ncbi:hypothetical protein SMICM304S_10205 [Streptomyces microflavus]
MHTSRPPPREPRLVEEHQYGTFRKLVPTEYGKRGRLTAHRRLRVLISHLPSLPGEPPTNEGTKQRRPGPHRTGPALAAPALMLERQGIIASLRRSAKLVRGAWWRTFGILALTQLLVLLVSFVVSIPFGIIALIADGTDMSELLEGGGSSFGWPFLIIWASAK